MLGSSHFVGRSFRALRSKIAVNAKSQSRSYYRPRYLSSSSLLAEWCYGYYDESGVPRFGEPTYTSSLGDEFNGSRGNNLKSSSVSPLTMTAFDDAMPEPRFSSVNEEYDSYDGGDGSGKSVDFGFTAAELAMVAARAEAEAANATTTPAPKPKPSESDAWDDLESSITGEWSSSS